jgi:hypothetical protein
MSCERYNIRPVRGTPPVATRSSGQTLQSPLTDHRQLRSDSGKPRTTTPTPTTRTTSPPTATTTTTTMSIQANPPPNPPPPPPAPTKTKLSDSFTPDVFYGKSTENPAEWLDYFEKYTDFKKIKDAEKVAFFKLLLRDNASDWGTSLTVTTWADIKTAFYERFTQDDLRRWQYTTAVWNRKQNPGESVDDYVTQVKFKN